MISFAPGYPDPLIYAWEEFREIANELLSGRDSSVLQYGPTLGHRPFIEALVELLATRGVRATTDEVLVTTGSQQGLDLVGRVLLDPGDVVLVELPAYTGAISAFRNTEAPAGRASASRPDGIDLDDLQAVVARERAAGPARCASSTSSRTSRTRRACCSRCEKRRRLLRVGEPRRRADRRGRSVRRRCYFEDTATAADTRPIKADDERGRASST